jgi:hypothetical protein
VSGTENTSGKQPDRPEAAPTGDLPRPRPEAGTQIGQFRTARQTERREFSIC